MGRYEQLQAYVAVVEHQGFTAAAGKSNIAKSMLSRRVNELEQRLGVKLLNRTTRKLSMTSAGEEFYLQARSLINGMQEAEDRLTEAQCELSGDIRIAAPLSFGLHHLAPRVNRFLCQHPAVSVDLDVNDREVDLVSEGYDLAIRVDDPRDSSLIARRLAPIRYVTVASPEYLKQHAAITHPLQLNQHQGLRYSNLSPKAQWRYVVEGKVVSVLPASRLSVNNGDILVAAAIDGLGVLHIPTFLVSDAIIRGLLVAILTEFESDATGLYALFAPGRLIPRRCRELVDFLQNEFGDCPDWDKSILSSH